MGRYKDMKRTATARHIIRFRRWSRKAYAAFASIGRCVTIGCLRKGVADSSLSKQKVAGTAGHAGCGEENTWEGNSGGKDTDIGISPESGVTLVNGRMVTGMNLKVLFRTQTICPCANTGKQEEYILKQENNTGTDCRNNTAHTMRCTNSGNPCLFFSNRCISIVLT